MVSQAGCPTLWRNGTLQRSWQRFNDFYETVVYFGSDEHEWAFVCGRADAVEQPVDRMVARLATLPYRPASIDAVTLRGSSVAPYSVRSAVSLTSD